MAQTFTRLIPVACAVLSLFFFTEAQRSRFDLGSQPADLTVSSSGQVFVATGSQLLRLEGLNLAMRENVTADDDVLNIVSTDGGKLVACLQDRSCAVYNANNLESGPEYRREEASARTQPNSISVALFTEPSGSFYTGSYGKIHLEGTGNTRLYMNQYGFGEVHFNRSSGTTRYRADRDIDRTFSTGFVKGSNAYYFVADHPGVRVVRVCHMDGCVGGERECEIAALYEAELLCGPDEVMVELCGVSLLESFADSSETEVIVAQCGSARPNINRICSYPLTTLDSMLDMKYEQCSMGAGERQVAWELGTGRNCAGTDFEVPYSFSVPPINSYTPHFREFREKPPVIYDLRSYSRTRKNDLQRVGLSSIKADGGDGGAGGGEGPLRFSRSKKDSSTAIYVVQV